MALLNESILCLITVLHLIVIIFVLGAPFSNSNYLLMMHVIIVPFIMFHWYLNNNTCSLTVAEKFIRQKTYGNDVNDDDCFTFKFIAPIYDFNKNNEDYSSFTWVLTTVLWGISVFNLSRKFGNGEIKEYNELFQV
jgi:hypothetical protein